VRSRIGSLAAGGATLSWPDPDPTPQGEEKLIPILTRRSALLGAAASSLFANDALACHRYVSPVDGRTGCGARDSDLKNGVSGDSGSTSTDSTTTSSGTTSSSNDASTQQSTSSDNTDSGFSGNTSKAIFELCPNAELLLQNETMSWPANSGRASIQSSNGMRYLQFDVKKGVAQTFIRRELFPFQNAPLSCAVYEFDVYLSPNYDFAATAPQISGQKGPGGLIGGFNYRNGKFPTIDNANPADVTAPELNNGFIAMHNWRSNAPDSYFYAYSANRYALGAKYASNTKKLFGKTYTPNQGTKKRSQPGKWSRISLVVKLNDDRQSNGRAQIWIDGIKTLDTGSRFMWLYEPSKSGGITGYRVEHMYGGNPSQLIPTQDQYERYRNLSIWGVRQ
jgi:hypothetical protein